MPRLLLQADRFRPHHVSDKHQALTPCCQLVRLGAGSQQSTRALKDFNGLVNLRKLKNLDCSRSYKAEGCQEKAARLVNAEEVGGDK